MLNIVAPADVGLDAERWECALALARDFCDQDLVPAIGMVVGRSDKTPGPVFFGRQKIESDAAALREDAIFLIASITKPVVATGAMLLIERGLIRLGDRVCDIVPEFGGVGKYGITLRHLMTHTSGLPDMLPNNRELRVAHQPLAAFVEQTCQVQTKFPSGRGVKYQSMGFAMLGEIIQRVSGKPCSQFLQDELFEPLGMNDTALGTPHEWYEGERPKVDRIAEIRIPDNQKGTDWGWNSRYWRSLGAPWGGLLTTPADLARFAQMLLNQGRCEAKQLLSPVSVRTATRNQLAQMPDIPEQDRRAKPWGLGWRLDWPAHSANFGDLLDPTAFGHWGSTGTVMWIDPALDAFAVILTTQPQEPNGSYLARLSNVLSAAMC